MHILAWTRLQVEEENRMDRNLSSKYQMDGAIVNQFRKLRLPVPVVQKYKLTLEC